jgi:hypothetical protein
MTIDDKYKDIIIDALNSYYTNTISMIVSKEKYGDKHLELRQLKLDISTILKEIDPTF